MGKRNGTLSISTKVEKRNIYYKIVIEMEDFHENKKLYLEVFIFFQLIYFLTHKTVI